MKDIKRQFLEEKKYLNKQKMSQDANVVSMKEARWVISLLFSFSVLL